MSFNKKDCEEGRARLDDQWQQFIAEICTFIRCKDRAGDVIDDHEAQLIDHEMRVEVGPKHGKCHIHALVIIEATGKMIQYDLKKVRERFPNTHWDFKYVKSDEDQTEAIMSYITKGSRKKYDTPREDE